jgi:hypothetical protein
MKCVMPRAFWVKGDGDYAVIAWCGEDRERGRVVRKGTVYLYPTLEAAERSKAGIDRISCGGKCMHQHEIVRLELP